MPKMIEVTIDSVRVSLTDQQRLVVLREKDAERYLPIWIGPYEAESITIALQEIEVSRPQTHDLIKNILHAMSARLVRIEIVSLREDVFYGNLVVEVNGRTVNIDCRPSDALAIAARAHVPILVSTDVMETAGIMPEEDVEDKPALPPARQIPPPAKEEASEERLSVFEDFLQNLDFDEPPDPSKDDEEPDDDEPDNGEPGDTPKNGAP
jgi:bifunctional DNase/RNase